jgi:hypothetical protein
MKRAREPGDARKVASAIEEDFKALPVCSTASLRRIRRKYSKALKSADAEFIFRLAHVLCEVEAYRWFACELLRNPRAAFETLHETALEEFGRGLNS